MTQQYTSFNQMGGGGGGHVNPNDLSMGGTFNGGFENSSGFGGGGGGGGYASGSGAFQDDELAETLASPSDGPPGLPGPGQEFPMDMSGMNMGYSAAGFNQNSMAMAQPHMNGYSSTPDGDPIQSPYIQGFSGQSFGQLNNAFNQLRTGPYSASPGGRMAQAMERKPSNTRTTLAKNSMMNGLPIGSAGSFAQPSPIRTTANGHEKTLPGGQYFQNPTPNSISSFPGSGFSSPVGPHAFRDAAHLNDLLIKQQGTSMPAKMPAQTSMTSSQEAKRRKRRESHNQVERRRRDNINERIQDLSKLVPTHRLEDEKIKKMIANGTPLSPTLEAITSPAAPATSGLAGSGARRAAGTNPGNITTGLPIEEKDKGPNKGDILNGAVAWTRDLMWLARLLVSHNEDMAEQLGHRPYEVTNEEERMTAELLHALARADETGEAGQFAYSRFDGSGLRVPDFTDYKGDPLDGTGVSGIRGGLASMVQSVSPDGDGLGGMASEFLDQDAVWGEDDMELKEEDEFMDMQ